MTPLRPGSPLRSRLVLALLTLPGLAGCPKGSQGAAPDAGSVISATSASAATAKDASAPSAGKGAGARAQKTALTPEQRKAVLAALDAGRKKTRAKDYAGAMSDFDRALAASPDDGRVLAELGYAAMLAGDNTRAAAANRRALTVVHDKKLRAQVLYNEGRVAEAQGDKEASRKAYAESLALRDNAEVRRRLTTAGGATLPPMPCPAGAATPEALCTCLEGDKTDLLGMPGDPPVCKVMPESLALGTPRLSLMKFGAEEQPGELAFLLLARDGGTLHVVANLGISYEPGAFGVHNEASVGKASTKAFGKRSVVVVTSAQDNADQNLAGLELCTENEQRETVCALGEGARTTRCVTVTVSSEGGCGPGVEAEDDEARAMIAEAKKSWSRSKQTSRWTVQDDGALVVSTDGKTVSYPLF
jgi:tetratricopeptide (TPR) repeat protein